MYQIDLDYIEDLATDLVGWDANLWRQTNDDEIEWGRLTEYDFSPFGTIDLDTYGHDGKSILMASYIIATKPEVILQMIQNIRELESKLDRNIK